MNKFTIFGIITMSSMFMAVYAYGAHGMNPMMSMKGFQYMPTKGYPMMGYGYGGGFAGYGGGGGAAGGIWSFLVFIIILIIISSIFTGGGYGKGGHSDY